MQAKLLTILALGFMSLQGVAAVAQDVAPESRILIKNVRVFDGISDALTEATNVLIEDNMIVSVSPGAAVSGDTTVINGGGRVLMPGLVDNHTHLSMVTVAMSDLLYAHPSYASVRSVNDAEDMLMRGVTTARDMGGNIFGLKRAVDEGIVAGPRIFPSGRFITQTSGHFDFRSQTDTHRAFSGIQPTSDRIGYTILADGADQVLAAARENLRLGASQIKIAAGGGYSSPTDPIMSSQFTFEEMKAAADAASDFGTYVTMHAYTPKAVNRAIDAGIKDVGHGQLLDRKTLQRMADEGVFLSTQPFTVCNEPQLDHFSNAKLAIVCEGTSNMYQLVKEIKGLKVTYGTDLFNVPSAADQVQQMDRLSPWFEPVEILQMATGNARDLLALSGDKNPYPEGPIGVIEEGAYADLLIVEGNPLDDIKIVGELDNLKIIMKDGVVYKNTLEVTDK